MLPSDGQLTDTPVVIAYQRRHGERGSRLTDYEMGGVALNDPSQGLLYQLWSAWVEADAVKIQAPSVPEQILFNQTGITELSLTFDQNMAPFVAFVANGTSTYWWFDPNAQAQVFSSLPSDAVSPRCVLDDKRRFASSYSDILLGYVRGTTLYYRLQRERYQTEHTLRAGAGNRLETLAMAENKRLMFTMARYNP